MNKRKILTTLICSLLLTATVLASCENGAGKGTQTGESTTETTASTTAEATTTTTQSTTQSTTAATTTGQTELAPIPQGLTAEVGETNQVISRLETPMTVEIYNGVTVDLQYQGWPSIGIGEDGKTIYAVSSLRTEHVDIFGAVAFTKSTDGGKTWEPMRIIIDTPLDDRDAGIIDLGNGHLMVTWFTHDASRYREGGSFADYRNRCTEEQLRAIDARLDTLTGEAAKSASFVAHSLDGGLTWGEPIAIPVTSPHGATLMQDGKSLVCIGTPKGTAGASLMGGHMWAYTSTDSGYTWTLLGGFAVPSSKFASACEPHIIQLRDGSFLAAFRFDQTLDNGTKVLGTALSRSEDGVLWEEPAALSQVYGSPPHLLELSNGIIVLSYGYRRTPTGTRARLSYDGGKTWGREIVLAVSDDHTYGDLGYPSTVELADGTLVTAYYQTVGKDEYRSFLYTTWKLK